MFSFRLIQFVAQAKPRLACANDNNIVGLGHRLLLDESISSVI